MDVHYFIRRLGPGSWIIEYETRHSDGCPTGRRIESAHHSWQEAADIIGRRLINNWVRGMGHGW